MVKTSVTSHDKPQCIHEYPKLMVHNGIVPDDKRINETWQGTIVLFKSPTKYIVLHSPNKASEVGFAETGDIRQPFWETFYGKLTLSND